jgi:RNA polymerase sigma-70 factor (ECF subfamily)
VREPDRTDSELVRLSGEGDQDAFRELFERKSRRVYLTAYQMLGNRALAEDVVQDAFLALWKHCRRYRPESTVDTWLTRITTNRAIDRWRGERRHDESRVTGAVAATTDGTRADPLEALESTRLPEADPTLRAQWAEVQELWDELAAPLPVQQRAAFVLRQIDGLSSAETAEAMGCTQSTVRSHLALARKALRKALAVRLAAAPKPPAG